MATQEQVNAALLRRLDAALEKKRLSPTESVLQGAGQGLTFGLSDELYGVGAAMIPGGQGYEDARDAARARLDRARPGYRLAGELVGSVAAPLGGAGLIARGGTALAKAGRAAGVGAGQAAAMGAGQAEGDLTDRALAGAKAAPLGAVIGGGAQATLGRLVGRGAPVPTEEAIEAGRRGIRVTRGQYTGQLDDLARENELRGVRGAGQQVIETFDQGQADDIARAVEDTAGTVGVRGVEFDQASSDVIGNLQIAERQAERLANREWQRVRDLEGVYIPEAAKDGAIDLAERFSRVINDNAQGLGLNPEVGGFLNSVAGKAMKESGLAESAALNAALKRQRLARDPASKALATNELEVARKAIEKKAPTIQRLEGMRQGFNTLMRREQEPGRRAGLAAMSREFDDWLETSISKELMHGDPDLLPQMAKARGLTKRYHTLFGMGPEQGPAAKVPPAERAAGKIMQTLIEESAGPEEAMRFMTRFQQTGGQGVRQTVTRIKRASPRAFDMLKTAQFRNMISNPKTGERLTPNRIEANLKMFLHRQPELAKTLYGTKGVKELAGLRKALASTDRKVAETGNPSRSGYAGGNLVMGAFRRLGLVSSIFTGDPRAAFLALLTEGAGNAEGLARARMATTIPTASRSSRAAEQVIPRLGRVAPTLQEQDFSR